MKAVIFGTDAFSRLVRYYLQSDSDREIVAFAVDREYAQEPEFDGLPVIAFDELDKLLSTAEAEVYVTCGYKQMNQIRKLVFNRCLQNGYQIGSYIHSSARVETSQLGMGNIILPNAHIAPFVKIGNGNIVFNDVIINHETTVGDFNYFAPGFLCGGLCTIGDCNFFGLGSVLRDSITVGDSNLVGASAYLPCSTGSNMLIKPAKTSINPMDADVLQNLL